MKPAELERLEKLSEIERSYYKKGIIFIAGMDEAGRGPLAGPVVAACVILPPGFLADGVNDSKKVAPEKREKLYIIIMNEALSVGIGIIDEQTIDRINILNATKMAMVDAYKKLSLKPDILLVDALKLDEIDIEQSNIIKGDTLSISIASASIIAKVTRDRIMTEYDGLYPEYGFAKHKGYATADHLKAIRQFGVCAIHRKTFTGC